MRTSLRMALLAMGAGIVLAAGTGAVAPAALAAHASAPGGPWSQTNYNAAQSRANLTEKTLTPATVGKVKYLRSVVTPATLPGPQGCRLNTVAAPVLTGGSLYAVVNGWLSRYDAANGQLMWRHRVTAGRVGTSLDYPALAVAGGLVVVGESYCGSVSDPNGFVQAYRASSGALAWSKPMPFEGPLDQMVVDGGDVVAAGGSPGGGDDVAVRNLTTGSLVWQKSYNFCAEANLAVVDQLVMSYRCNNSTNAESLTARNIGTGALAWSRAGAWQIQRGDLAGPSGRHFYAVSPSGSVLDLNPANGHTQHTLSGATAVLAVDSSQAYAACGSSSGVCAYSTSTGALVWNSPNVGSPAPAAEAGRVLYVGSGDAVNASTGEVMTFLWSGQAQSLVVGNGRIGAVTDARVLDLYGLAGS